MNKEVFADLVEGIWQAGEIRKGLREPGRVIEFTPLDIMRIQQKLDKSHRGILKKNPPQSA